MLTDLEKDRLINRYSENSHTRSTNDTRIRKKLQAWMREIPDIMFILHHLPQEQLDKVISDDDVISFLELGFVAQVMKIFCPVFGDLEKPEEWKILDWNVVGEALKYGDEDRDLLFRPAEERDIARAVMLIDVIKKIVGDSSNLVLEVNRVNPIDVAMSLAGIYSNPDLRQRLTEGEIRGIEKINQILEKHGPKKWIFPHKSPGHQKAGPIHMGTNKL
jgi:hypothetical protein